MDYKYSIRKHLNALEASQRELSETMTDVMVSLSGQLKRIEEKLDDIERFLAWDGLAENPPDTETKPLPLPPSKVTEDCLPLIVDDSIVGVCSDAEIAVETGFSKVRVGVLRNRHKDDSNPSRKFGMRTSLTMLGYRSTGKEWVRDYAPLIPNPYKTWLDFPDIDLRPKDGMTANSLGDSQIADRLWGDDSGKNLARVRTARWEWYATPLGEDSVIDAIAKLGFFPNPVNGRWYLLG